MAERVDNAVYVGRERHECGDRGAGNQNHRQHDRGEGEPQRGQLVVRALGDRGGGHVFGRVARGDGPAAVGPKCVGETDGRGEGAQQEAGDDHGADVDLEGVGGEERAGRGRHERVRHRGADGDGEHVEQVVFPGARGHRPGQRDEQEKNRVEKHRHPEHEAAGGEDERGAFFAEEPERGTHDAVGPAAVQQADADDRGHGDQHAKTRAGAAELVGEFRAEMLLRPRFRFGRRAFCASTACSMVARGVSEETTMAAAKSATNAWSFRKTMPPMTMTMPISSRKKGSMGWGGGESDGRAGRGGGESVGNRGGGKTRGCG
jgi:hypothetical protein